MLEVGVDSRWGAEALDGSHDQVVDTPGVGKPRQWIVGMQRCRRRSGKFFKPVHNWSTDRECCVGGSVRGRRAFSVCWS